MGRSLETTVKVSIPAPVEQVWEVWADLEATPKWMKWIESVCLTEDGISEWTLATQGLRLNWRARITQIVEGRELHWESVDGLSNKGFVSFTPQSDGGTTARLSIKYEVPALVAPLINSGLLARFVRKELLANLERFLDLVTQKYQ